MSWKFVLDGSNFEAGTNMRVIVENAINCGYAFFTHNGNVYFIGADEVFMTPLKVGDLF